MKDADRSVGVAWTTLSGPAEVTVEYGTQPGQYSKQVTGTMQAIGGPLGSVSEAVLTGLQASTRYYYRVGGAGGGFSPEYSFKTAPPPDPECGTSRFVFVGDSRAESFQPGQGASNLWPTVLAQAASMQPNFVLHGGDIIYSGSDATLWAHHLKASAPISASLPLMYAIGNHDDGPGEGESAHYNKLLNLPRSEKADGGSGTEDHYYFTYANAIFVALSTATFKGGATPFAEQAAWLDKVLTAHPKRWRVVYLHHPIYTDYIFINHKPNEVSQNAALVPIFNKHKVDLVFQSHNHFYERFLPSACTNGGSSTPCPTGNNSGTTFITSGGAGAFALPIFGFTRPERPVASSAMHFVLVDIADNRLDLQTIEVGGSKKVFDQFTVTKPLAGPDPCAAPPQVDSGLPDTGLADAGASADVLPLDLATSQADLQSDRSGARDALGEAAPAGDAAAPAGSGGCDCQLGSTTASASGGLWLLGLALVLALHRRRRRRSTCH